MKPEKFTDEFISVTPVVMLQRLGYILEKLVGNVDLSEPLYSKLTNTYPNLQRMPLKSGKPETGYPSDPKWKIVINDEIEIDE
jgi:predicted transcriptional regulator of viral defense system